MKPEKKQRGEPGKKILINRRNGTLLVDTFVKERKPTFCLFNRNTGETKFADTVTILDHPHSPLNPDSNYISSGSLIFPNGLTDYGSTEKLLEEIGQYVYRYCDISPVFARIVPYYVLMTYLYDTFHEIPYLRVIGDYGSGKSRFLRIVGNICYSPIVVNGGASVSSIFRMIEITKGTLILDEADFQYSDTTNEIIKLLNNGFAKGNPILRADGDNYEPRAYDVFCPKIIGGRMEFRDKATESRCIVEVMRRTARKDVPLNLSSDFDRESAELRNKLYQFRYDYHGKIPIQEERIEGLEGRLNQILNPILSIIRSAGMEKDYANIVSYFLARQKEIREDRKFSDEGLVFSIIQHKESNPSGIIYYSEILSRLKELDATSNVNPRKLGSLLKHYEIRTIRRNDGFVIPVRDNRDRLDSIYKTFDLNGSVTKEEVDDAFL